MTALLVGFLLVAVSSVGFGAALFWHRPSPQVATTDPRNPLATTIATVPPPSPVIARHDRRGATVAGTGAVTRGGSQETPSTADEAWLSEPDAALVDEVFADIPPPPPPPVAPPPVPTRPPVTEPTVTEPAAPPPAVEPERPPATIAPRRPVTSEPAKPIKIGPGVRLRAGALLLLTVLILAALFGAVLSAVAILVGLILG